MSHKLSDILKAVQRAKETTLIETKDGEAVAIWRREKIGEVIIIQTPGVKPVKYLCKKTK